MYTIIYKYIMRLSCIDVLLTLTPPHPHFIKVYLLDSEGCMRAIEIPFHLALR